MVASKAERSEGGGRRGSCQRLPPTNCWRRWVATTPTDKPTKDMMRSNVVDVMRQLSAPPPHTSANHPFIPTPNLSCAPQCLEQQKQAERNNTSRPALPPSGSTYDKSLTLLEFLPSRPRPLPLACACLSDGFTESLLIDGSTPGVTRRGYLQSCDMPRQSTDLQSLRS